MQRRGLKRVAGLATTAMILTALSAGTAVSALAETVTADGDTVTAGIQGTIDLGTAAPGADVRVDVAFSLACTGTSHVDPGQMVRLTPGIITVPVGGSFGVGSLLFSPGPGWPADGDACPADLTPVTSPPLRVIVTAPPDPGVGYRYAFTWNRSLSPVGNGDSSVFSGSSTTLVFLLNVADNTPPTLNLPADSTIEGNTSGGATAAYSVSASDLEDTVAPTPSCSPAVGALLPLGTDTINCTVTDGGGLTTTGAFTITVVDTTAPSLADVPTDRSIVTGDPGGAVLTYTNPTATDVVDPSPSVACLPASGSTIPVGVTTVTCTATDASGNHSSGSFQATVSYVPPVTWGVAWGEPVGSSGDTFVANPGRVVPIKVGIFANGVDQRSGRAVLSVARCDGAGGGAALTVSLSRDSGRWTGRLDTSALAGPGCYTATVSLDGQAAGSFQLELRGSTAGGSSHSIRLADRTRAGRCLRAV